MRFRLRIPKEKEKVRIARCKIRILRKNVSIARRKLRIPRIMSVFRKKNDARH